MMIKKVVLTAGGSEAVFETELVAAAVVFEKPAG